jgi:histone H4
MVRNAHIPGTGKGKRFLRSAQKPPLSKSAIRRMARQGGVRRVSGLVYDEVRNVLKDFLTETLHDAVIYTEHARRNTVTALDVVYALKRRGRLMYGYGV